MYFGGPKFSAVPRNLYMIANTNDVFRYFCD